MAKLIIEKLFDTNKSFKKEDFIEFISDLTGKIPKENSQKDEDGDSFIILNHGCERLENLGIFIYKLPNNSKVDKARIFQRNKISKYLKNEGIYSGIDSVLVAFYSDDSTDWRLSFVKQEFKLSETEFYKNGKKKIVNELTPAKRYSFLVESNSKNVTVKQRLNSLLESSNILVSDIEKTFSVEKVSKEFFDKYVKLYEKLVEAFKDDKVFLKIISESNNGDENFRENFVKKLLGQIVFLYFLQKKGWLGVPKNGNWGEGNKNFLQDLLKECLSGGDDKKELGGKNFFNDYLEHLFYANLNQKRENDYSEYFNCRIPYLNGGLFEPINNYHWKGFEYVVLAGDKNNALFKEIFDTFDEYNFTVYENDPLEQDIAVDPEMLGKVFENLLPENERKGKGAFYTPREIVHYMCKESLKNHIINKTGITEEKINGLFDRKDSMYNSKKFGKELSSDERYNQFGEFIDYAESIVNTLKTVKIVDPAVGSGAFPMGLLKEIVSLRKYLQENILLEDNVSEYQIKKETLENCIYGVDLDPGAVEIAKLRFWLSLVIEEDSKDNIAPLPNLDYKIMQGNSLIEDIVVGDTVIPFGLENSFKRISKIKEKEIINQIKIINTKHGIEGQMKLLSDYDDISIDEIKIKLEKAHKDYFNPFFIGDKKKLKKEIDGFEISLLIKSFEEEKNRISKEIEKVESKKILGGALTKNELNIIEKYNNQIVEINNTEIIYKRNLEKNIQNIRSFFPWKLHFGEVFNDNGGFDIVIGNPPYVNTNNIDKGDKKYYKDNFLTSESHFDLYSIFYEISINFLLKEMGIISFITSNKWMTQKYGTNLRLLFLKYKLLKIIDFDTVKIFEKATVDTEITILEKSKTNKDYEFLKYFFNKDEDDLKLDNKVYSNLSKNTILRNNGIFKLNINENELKLYEKIKLISFNASVKFNILYGMVVHPSDNSLKKKDFIYDNNFNNNLVKYTEGKHVSKWKIDKILFLDYTPQKHREPRKKEYFETNKILCHRLAGRGRLRFVLDENNVYVDNTLHLIIPNNTNIDLKYYISLFNSKLLSWIFKTFLSTNLDVYPDHIKNLPLIESTNKESFTNITNQILEIIKKDDYLEREELQKQVKVLESRIDDMVYKLYELTPEEIELVKESLK